MLVVSLFVSIICSRFRSAWCTLSNCSLRSRDAQKMLILDDIRLMELGMGTLRAFWNKREAHALLSASHT